MTAPDPTPPVGDGGTPIRHAEVVLAGLAETEGLPSSHRKAAEYAVSELARLRAEHDLSKRVAGKALAETERLRSEVVRLTAENERLAEDRADAERFATLARERGYPLEAYRALRDDRIAKLTKAGMWPPRLRPLEPVRTLTSEGADR